MNTYLRADIIRKCPKEFKKELNIFIDEIKESVEEIKDDLSIEDETEYIYRKAEELHNSIY